MIASHILQQNNRQAARELLAPTPQRRQDANRTQSVATTSQRQNYARVSNSKLMSPEIEGYHTRMMPRSVNTTPTVARFPDGSIRPAATEQSSDSVWNTPSDNENVTAEYKLAAARTYGVPVSMINNNGLPKFLLGGTQDELAELHGAVDKIDTLYYPDKSVKDNNETGSKFSMLYVVAACAIALIVLSHFENKED